MLLLSFCLNIYFISSITDLKERFNSILNIYNHLDQNSVLAFMASQHISEINNKDIEIFDITKGEVVKKVSNSLSIRNTAIEYLNDISGMFVKVNAFPDNGIIIRIPFTPPVKVNSHWLTDYNMNYVDQVYILYPNEGTPYLLVLDEQQKPYFFNFIGDTEKLKNHLGL